MRTLLWGVGRVPGWWVGVAFWGLGVWQVDVDLGV